MTRPDADEILSALRSQGMRATTQRRLVIDTLLSGPANITAEALTASVRALQPEIAPSTVYRILDALEQQGIVQHAHLGHGPAQYHLAENEHLHLVCEACGLSTEVPKSAYRSFAARLTKDYGFVASLHHFAVLGRCVGCVDKPAIAHDGNEARLLHD